MVPCVAMNRAVVSAFLLGNMTRYLKSHPISRPVPLTIKCTLDFVVFMDDSTYYLGFLDLRGNSQN